MLKPTQTSLRKLELEWKNYAKGQLPPPSRQQLITFLDKIGKLEGFYQPSRAELIKAFETLDAPYQHPVEVRWMNQYRDAIERAATRYGGSLQFSPAVGSAPTGAINAQEFHLGEKGCVILFHRGIFLFFTAICGIIARATLPRQTDSKVYEWRNHDVAKVDTVTVDRLIATLRALLSQDDELQDYVKARAESEFALPLTELADALGEFVFAHEYGHILLKHDTSMNWKQEFEADNVGLDLLALSESWVPWMFRLGGVYILFHSIDIVYKALGLLQYGDETRISQTSLTHPAPMERLRTLEGLVLSAGSKDAAVYAVSYGRQCGEVLQKAFSSAKDELASLHRRGVRCTSTWLRAN